MEGRFSLLSGPYKEGTDAVYIFPGTEFWKQCLSLA